MTSPNRFLITAALLLLCASTALAQGTRADTLPRPILTVLRITEPIAIDGRLDEGAWLRAQPATDWIQRVPNNLAKATQRSEARVLIDETNVYVGFRLFDTHPESIGVQLARRDVGDTFTDWAWVGFDSYFDRRTAFVFAISPRGAQRDGYVFNDVEFDDQWDAVWQSSARVDSLGWTAELRIPLSQLRYAAGDSTRRWGINFLREIARNGESDYWSPRNANEPGDASRFGDLAGLGALKGRLPLEIIPYVRSQINTTPPDPGNPFRRASANETAIGVDLRTRLPKSLTLTATVNPDFGQVEADPAVVNLSAFEVFFNERRPFFLESADAFAFGGTTTDNDNDAPNFFYSRRIGRRPQRSPSGGAAFTDVPSQTPILAAAKISGTTPGGWSLGILNATTGRESGRYQTTTGSIARENVEPLTNYNVTRARRLLRGGFTSIGAFGSLVTRDLSDTLFHPLLTRTAAVYGADFQHAWGNRTWALSGVVSRSDVRGEEGVITRLQRANYRTFQRPDASHLELDPTRTSLQGGYYALSAAKTGGRLTGSITAEQIDPAFETNDAGFQTRSDLRSLSTALFYRQPSRTSRFQSWGAGIFSTTAWNTAGDNLERRLATFSEVQFHNFWSLSWEGNIETGQYNDRLLRGGPIAARPVSSRHEFGIETDARRRLIAGLGVEVSVDRGGNRSQSVGLELDWRPLPAARVRVEPEFAASDITNQYVTSVGDALATSTYGRRYIFGDVRQREARLNTRLDWTFSPYVSLQLFLQPFASAGRFLSYKEFLRPKEFAFARYGETRGTSSRAGGRVTVDPDGAGSAASFSFAEQDYTARELRGNAVLRWELRPGSSLFLVWQQTRDAFFDGTADLDAASQLGSLLNEPARNVFLVKLAWWLGR